jgi:hypothetical protein
MRRHGFYLKYLSKMFAYRYHLWVIFASVIAIQFVLLHLSLFRPSVVITDEAPGFIKPESGLRVQPLTPPDSRQHAFLESDNYLNMFSRASKVVQDIKAFKRTFQEKGFVKFKPRWSSELDSATQFTQVVWDTCIVSPEPKPPKCRLWLGANNTKSNLHQDKFTHQPGVRGVALHPDVLAVLAVLNGRNPYPFQTLNYPASSLARTHSDYVHFAPQPSNLMCGVWVALEDIDPKAGPVFYYPGSHLLDFYSMQDLGLQPRESHHLNYAKYQDIMEAHMDAIGLAKEFAVLKKGEALIWTSNLVHGGPPPELPGKSRLSQVTHYFFVGAYYNWAPVMSDVTENKVVYYDEDSVKRKWDENAGTPDERFEMSKFREGTCKEHGAPPGVQSPCELINRPPRVFSKLLEHDVEAGESIMR